MEKAILAVIAALIIFCSIPNSPIAEEETDCGHEQYGLMFYDTSDAIDFVKDNYDIGDIYSEHELFEWLDENDYAQHVLEQLSDEEVVRAILIDNYTLDDVKEWYKLYSAR